MGFSRRLEPASCCVFAFCRLQSLKYSKGVNLRLQLLFCSFKSETLVCTLRVESWDGIVALPNIRGGPTLKSDEQGRARHPASSCKELSVDRPDFHPSFARSENCSTMNDKAGLRRRRNRANGGSRFISQEVTENPLAGGYQNDHVLVQGSPERTRRIWGPTRHDTAYR